MTWERADEAEIEPARRYVVITNGGEYDDYPATMIMLGEGVKKRLHKDIAYHRPVFLAPVPGEIEEHIDAFMPSPLHRRKRRA